MISRAPLVLASEDPFLVTSGAPSVTTCVTTVVVNLLAPLEGPEWNEASGGSDLPW